MLKMDSNDLAAPKVQHDSTIYNSCYIVRTFLWSIRIHRLLIQEFGFSLPFVRWPEKKNELSIATPVYKKGCRFPELHFQSELGVEDTIMNMLAVPILAAFVFGVVVCDDDETMALVGILPNLVKDNFFLNQIFSTK